MSARRTSPILIGREAELRALEEAVVDRAERPVALVGGEAGVGKTRLVRELRARQLAAGATVVIGSCVELGADLLPYAPFVESLGRLVEDLGDRADELLGTERRDLATLLPGLAEVTGAPPAGGSRGRMYEAVRAVLDRAPSPLVLVLEDIHWADRSTLELLDYLARRLRHGRTLLLATYRSDELHRRHPLLPLLAELERTGRSTTIKLGPLDREQVARLVRELGADASPVAALDSISRRSEGNPFLVEELVAAGAGGADQLPGTVRELLLARVAAVDAATRRALGIVAAVGREAEAELVEMAWGGPEAELDGALRDAVDRGLLVMEPGNRRRLAFRHALLAEAVVDDLLPGERVRLHATLARILSERPDLASATPAGAAAELAHHLLGSRDQAAALAAVVRAGDAASVARAHPEARASYERALELWERVPDAATRAGIDHATLLDRAAEASFHAGDAARAVALGRLAVAEAEAGGDPVRIGWLLVRLIEWTEEVGDFDALVSLSERALALVPEEPASPERAFAMLGAASVRIHHCRNRELVEAAGEAARIAEACGAVGYEAIARSMRGSGLVGLARDDEAFEELERAFALATASGGTEEIVIVNVNRVATYGYSGHLDRLGPLLADARRAVDREGALILSEPFYDFWEAALRLCDGRWPDAEAIISRHLDRGVAGPPIRADLLAVRGTTRVRRGAIGEGETDLHAALAIRPAVHPESVAACYGSLAEAALSRGDGTAAAALVDDALAALESTDEVMAKTFACAVGLRAAADVAERSRARREHHATESIERVLERHVATVRAALDGRLVEAAGVNGYVRAMAAWGLAEASRAEAVPKPDAWAAAASLLPAVGETHLAAYCRYREGEAVLAGSGDRPRAVETLRAARAWALKVGAEPLLRDVDALARRARLELAEPTAEPLVPPAAGPRVPSDPYGLSPREREVLAMLVDGRTNREIGASLFISEKTASVHVTHILDKLGVTSRGAAAALAARAGLLDAPDG